MCGTCDRSRSNPDLLAMHSALVPASCHHATTHVGRIERFENLVLLAINSSGSPRMRQFNALILIVVSRSSSVLLRHPEVERLLEDV